MIDKASVFAERFKNNPQILQATVLGQGPDPSLDPYTALRALQLIKESNAMAMARQAQQPTSAPSLASQAVAPQGLAAMLPMGAPVGQMGQAAPQAAPQAPVMQASGGLASMPTPDEDYAAGGIVAFNGQTGSAVRDPDAVAVTDDPFSRLNTDGEGTGLENLMFTSKGDPETYAALAKLYPEAITSLGNIKETEIKPETLRKISADEITAFREAMGPNVAEESMRADIKARKGEMGKNLEEGKGVALLKAAMAVTQGNNWVRAFAGAGAAFGDEYNRALQADKAEKRSIALAEFNLADAKRKENLGLFKEGRAAQDRYVSAVKAADKARLDKAKAYADAIKGGMNATKPLRSALGSGAGGANMKDFVVGPETYLAQIKEEHPEWSPAKQKAEAFKQFQQGKSAGLQGAVIKADTATAQLTAALNRKVMDRLADWEDSTEAKKAKKLGTFDELYQTMYDKYVAEAMANVTAPKPAAATPAASSAAPATVLNYDANGKRIN